MSALLARIKSIIRYLYALEFRRQQAYYHWLLWGAWKHWLKGDIKQSEIQEPIFLHVLQYRSLAPSCRGLSFSELTELTCRRKIKKNEFNFFPSENVCLLERRIHSRFRGTFDLGLHRKLEDENSTFGLGGLMIEKPEVWTVSEVKMAAESASKQGRTLQSGLLHDCRFFPLEKKIIEEKNYLIYF